MKNLKEQYERYFGKLTERAKTSDSDVRLLVRNMKITGFVNPPLKPKEVVDFLNKYDKPGRPMKAKDLNFIMNDNLSDGQMVMAAIRSLDTRSEMDRLALRELDRYYKKYSDEKKGFL